MEDLRRLKVEGESLLQEKHAMAQQLSAAQDMVSDLNNEVDTLKTTLNEARSSAGCVCCCFCLPLLFTVVIGVVTSCMREAIMCVKTIPYSRKS